MTKKSHNNQLKGSDQLLFIAWGMSQNELNQYIKAIKFHMLLYLGATTGGAQDLFLVELKKSLLLGSGDQMKRDGDQTHWTISLVPLLSNLTWLTLLF